MKNSTILTTKKGKLKNKCLVIVYKDFGYLCFFLSPESLRLGHSAVFHYSKSARLTMEVKIPVPWGHVAGKSFGSWSGTPLLAIHSFGQNSGSFYPLVAHLSKEVQFLAIDLPGHGLSSHLPPGIPYHRVDYVPLIKRIVDHQKWKKFSLLGHGDGAELAILFAAAFSNSVERVILIGRIQPSFQSDVERAQNLAAAIDTQLDNDEKYEEYQKNPPMFTEADAVRKELEATSGEISEENAKILIERGMEKVGEGEFSYRRDFRLTTPDTLLPSEDQSLALLEGLQGKEVLIIRTAQTSSEDKGAVEKLKRISKVFVEVEAEGGSYAHMEKPENVANLIENFLIKGQLK